jgi:hypothetical protein
LNVTTGTITGLIGTGQVSVVFTNRPIVTILEPTAGAPYHGPINIVANVSSPTAIAYVSIKINGVEVANLSSAPYTTSIDSATYTDGLTKVNVTALGANGKVGYNEISITIDNAGQEEPLVELAWTIIAGSLAILAGVVTVTVAIMFYRSKKGGGA